MSNFYNCSFLNSGLHFTPEHMRFCCATVFGPYVNIDKFDYDKVLSALFEKRNQLITDMHNHLIPKECETCIYLKELDSDDDKIPQEILSQQKEIPKISSIIINHYKQCDCYCIYCSQFIYQKKITTVPIKSEFYDLLPIIERLYKQDMIDKENLKVEFQGGSIGVLEEFPELVKIFLDNNVKHISFFSNGIKYSPEIVETAKKAECMIICSVDAGSPEVFKKLKSVDKYDQVISNLKRYKQEAPNSIINAKYILINDVNDSIEEIEKYLVAVADAKVDMVQLDMDFKKVMCFKGVHYDVPKKHKEIFAYFEKRAKELGIRPFIWEYIQSVLDKGYFE